mmetsp:Transcript_42014/g.65685  ORF Transcript_42014/g.65685 Transcript_42014/m.65685 type:complete len:82 (-) Transcript_42014:182-427(-)
MIARNLEDYLALAIRLGGGSRHKAWKERVSLAQNPPIFDVRLWNRRWERLLRMLYEVKEEASFEKPSGSPRHRWHTVATPA